MGDALPDQQGNLADSLSATEKRVWDAFPRGEKVDLGVGDPQSGNPRDASSWGESRKVRGEVLAALLLGARDPAAGHAPALRLAGALVVGVVNLKQAVVHAPVELTGCRIMDGVRLAGATLQSVDFSALWGVGSEHAGWGDRRVRPVGGRQHVLRPASRSR